MKDGYCRKIYPLIFQIHWLRRLGCCLYNKLFYCLYNLFLLFVLQNKPSELNCIPTHFHFPCEYIVCMTCACLVLYAWVIIEVFKHCVISHVIPAASQKLWLVFPTTQHHGKKTISISSFCSEALGLFDELNLHAWFFLEFPDSIFMVDCMMQECFMVECNLFWIEAS